MKSLKNYVKNYIKDYIDESVWDIEDNIDSDNKESILNDIKKFIEDNYEHINIDRCKIVFDEKKGKYVVNYKESVALKSNSKQIVNEMFEWGTINGWFDCSGCKNLESLKGAPEIVGGTFSCSQCPITSLEGAPKRVGGTFYCFNCPKLESLEGAPEYVGGEFDCYSCTKLTTLKGAPEIVGGTFSCSKCPIISLVGAPKEVGEIFDCSYCSNLESLKGAPKSVGKSFDCRNCPKLSSLDGIGKVKGKIFSDIG